MEKQKSLLHYVSVSDSGACFSLILFFSNSVSLRQQTRTHTVKKRERAHVHSLSRSWRQTQPFRLSRSITQLSVFDSVSICGAQGPLLLPLQSSTVLLLHLLRRLLLVASLSLAPALSFAERRWQAATQLVSDGTGYNVMPLWLVAVQKSETCCELLAVFQQCVEYHIRSLGLEEAGGAGQTAEMKRNVLIITVIGFPHSI